MGLPNPYLILGAIVVAIGLYFYGHHEGWRERDLEMQAEIAKKNDEARKTEEKLTEQVNQTATKLQEANDVVTQKQTALDRAIRAGRVRLPATGCVQTTPNPASTTGDQTDGSESDRQTLLLIAQIAADGDQAINRLNACISAYEQVRAQLNGVGRE